MTCNLRHPMGLCHPVLCLNTVLCLLLSLVGLESWKSESPLSEYRLFCRALLQKRPIILRSLLIGAQLKWLDHMTQIYCQIKLGMTKHDNADILSSLERLRATIYWFRCCVYYWVSIKSWKSVRCGIFNLLLGLLFSKVKSWNNKLHSIIDCWV